MSPLTVTGLAEPMPVILSGYEVTVYVVMALPPSDAGGVKATDADEPPAMAVPMVGAPGRVYGMTLTEADDVGPVPAVLVAVTEKV